jgi:hypothetical protein
MYRLLAFVTSTVMFVIADILFVIADILFVIADVMFVIADVMFVIADLIRNPVFALTGCRIESGMTTMVFPAFLKRHFFNCPLPKAQQAIRGQSIP